MQATTAERELDPQDGAAVRGERSDPGGFRDGASRRISARSGRPDEGDGAVRLNIPEEYGGAGVDTTTFAMIFEEISRGWLGLAG